VKLRDLTDEALEARRQACVAEQAARTCARMVARFESDGDDGRMMADHWRREEARHRAEADDLTPEA
jgi:hypothetical protein